MKKKTQRLCAIYYFKGRKLGIWIKHLGILTQKYLAKLGEEREKRSTCTETLVVSLSGHFFELVSSVETESDRVATILQNHESLIAGSFKNLRKNLPIHESVRNW